MLHKETVKPGTLDLILRLMEDDYFSSFYLVGGTALSLKIGHRESIDIDLFNSGDFDFQTLSEHLQIAYSADIKNQKSNYISGNISKVDFDLISHKFKAIKPIETIEGVRMMSLEDISAMKINAIVNSGERIKDYIDIFYLLKDMSLDHIFGYYCEKYPNVDADMARSSLLYHKDIDFSVPVKLYDKDLKWKSVANGITKAVRTYDNLQESRKLYWKMQDIKKKGKGKDRGLSM
jgi:hypothetical protein